MKDSKKLFWLLLSFTIFGLFFINKAYHIDDPFTITIAKAIGEHFIRVPQVYQGDFIFMGDVYHNPLLLGYYFAPIIKIFQDKEVWLHLFYLPFSWLSILAMYFLSRRFIGRGIFAAGLLAVSPVFVVMSQNIMLDIPLLAFFLGALAAFIYGVDKDNKRLLYLSAVLAGLAILTKYSGIMVVFIMFSYALLSGKKKYSLFLLIPAGMLLLWCLHNFIFYQHVYLLDSLLKKGSNLSPEIIQIRAFAVLSFLSGASICVIFLIPYLLSRKINRLFFILSLPLGLCPFLIKGFSSGFNNYLGKRFYFSGYSSIEKSMLAVFFVASFFIILMILNAGVTHFFKKDRNKDNLFLSLWFMALLIFTIIVQFVAARFVLLLFPPMFLLIVKELSLNKDVSFNLRSKYIVFAIGAAIVISGLLSAGDYQLSGAYRDFVVSLKKKLPTRNDIYFCQSSFDTNLCYGYAYYLRKYYPQAAKNEIEASLNKDGGFIYVVPAGAFLSPVFHENCSDYFQGLTYKKDLIGSFRYQGNVFLHDRRFHAGFYSHDWGLLPFYISFKEAPLEIFEVYQITSERPVNMPAS
ncbi:MAG: glycosyltransferase family 39 protein [Candidatus Omnitrophica bacterium]|nr:glycosyltransferase family 39 protein [Candidatus Omnitrophota bacterium]